MDAERQALGVRYRDAKERAVNRNCEAALEAFEHALADSKAVIARSFGKTLEMAAGDRSVFGTYYREIQGGLRLPDGNQWDVLRQNADQKLFGDYKKEIRFAALSLDDKGLDHYGDCSWVLLEDMVAHRASTFEANSAVFVTKLSEEQVRAGGSLQDAVPAGYRAPWQDRAKHGVAKLASRIEGSTASDAFGRILLRSATNPADDDFIEVHIGGPMTVRTLEKVVVHKGPSSQALKALLANKLDAFGVSVESRT